MDFGKATIIAAVVTGFFSFIMMIVREFITNKGIKKDMQNFKDCIFGDLNTLKSGQTESRNHTTNLLNDHISISNGLNNMNAKVDKTAEIISNIDIHMKIEKAKEEDRIKMLSEKQVDLINIAEKIGNMAKEIKVQQENIKELESKLKKEKTKVETLKQENEKLKDELLEKGMER